MKRTLITIITVAIFTATFAGDPGIIETSPAALPTVTGNVKDLISGEFLTGVKVILRELTG